MENQNTSVMSVKDWLITILIAAIPIVNVIMLFVWAFSSGTNLNKQNWSRATLIWFAIFFVLYLVLFIILGVGSAMMNT